MLFSETELFFLSCFIGLGFGLGFSSRRSCVFRVCVAIGSMLNGRTTANYVPSAVLGHLQLGDAFQRPKITARVHLCRSKCRNRPRVRSRWRWLQRTTHFLLEFPEQAHRVAF
jgi:hypothetical protein